ncbi:MAG: hypothetical protein U0Z26_01585 [Anaerolineales bacterium]
MTISLDLITGLVSLIFTLMIFSYIFGDNALFRLALYIFTGVSAGYIAMMAWWQVLWPKLFQPLLTNPMQGNGLLFVPLLGVFLIVLKMSSRLSGVSRVAMAYLVGVGAAITVVGAVSGTLIPQFTGTVNAFDLGKLGATKVLIDGSLILLGTVFSLIYFHFGARPKADGVLHRNGLIEAMAWVGRIFIGITLGVIFAGVYAAALTALIERAYSILSLIGKLQ